MVEVKLVGGTSGAEYTFTEWELVKKIGEFPVLTVTMHKDQLDPLEDESYFEFFVDGTRRHKGIIIKPIEFDKDNEMITIIIDDYIWILYRDYDLFNTTGSGYRVETVNELVDTTVDNIISGTGFSTGTTPPQYINNRYDYNDRIIALKNLAALTKYGQYTDGTYWTDIAKIVTEVGSCDVWLDYAASTVNIGILGATEGSSDQWVFDVIDITDHISVDSITEFKKKLVIPNTVIVLGAGDGLNQIVGKASNVASTEFFDDVSTSKSISYSAWTDWPFANFTWSHDTVNKWIKAAGGIVQNMGCYTINTGIDYSSPRLRFRGQCNDNGGLSIGAVIGRVDLNNFWHIIIQLNTPTGQAELWGYVSGVSSRALFQNIPEITVDTYYDFEIICNQKTKTISVYINNELLFSKQDCNVSTGEVSLYCDNVGGIWDFKFTGIMLEETDDYSPVMVISDSKYIDLLSATNAAKTILKLQRVSEGFSVGVSPTIFFDDILDIGMMVSLTKPAEAVGTYRIQEMTITEEKCTLSLGLEQKTLTSQISALTSQTNVIGSYNRGATVSQALPSFDSPIFKDATPITTYAYLSFKIPSTMLIINSCELFWYLDYMMVDEEWKANNSSTAFGTDVAVEISIDGGSFAAINGSPFTGNQTSVSILGEFGYAPQGKIVVVRYSMNANGEARIYGGGNLEGLVVK